MASAAQIAANRANAQHSTGPVTEEGKAKSRMNARRSGITGQITTLSEGDRAAFDNLTDELLHDLKPQTAMELTLAHAIAWDTWRLDRIRAMETNLYALHANDPDVDTDSLHPDVHAVMSESRAFGKESKQFQLMSLYEQRISRSLHKNIAALHEMQAERKREYERERDNEILLARASEIKGLPYVAPAPSVTKGFIFSTEQILAAAARKRALEEAEYIVRTAKPAPIKVAKAA